MGYIDRESEQLEAAERFVRGSGCHRRLGFARGNGLQKGGRVLRGRERREYGRRELEREQDSKGTKNGGIDANREEQGICHQGRA